MNEVTKRITSLLPHWDEITKLGETIPILTGNDNDLLNRDRFSIVEIIRLSPTNVMQITGEYSKYFFEIVTDAYSPDFFPDERSVVIRTPIATDGASYNAELYSKCLDIYNEIDIKNHLIWGLNGNLILFTALTENYVMNNDAKEAIIYLIYAIETLARDYRNRLNFESGSESLMNDPDSCFLRGNTYDAFSEYEKAFEYYMHLANYGHANAQEKVGYYYEHGFAVKQSYSEAINWYLKSADQGNAAAQFHAACCYATGLGAHVDLNKAFTLFYKSAHQGNSAAQLNLGRFYELGNGVERDFNKAIYWYEKAEKNGETISKEHIELCRRLQHILNE